MKLAELAEGGAGALGVHRPRLRHGTAERTSVYLE